MKNLIAITKLILILLLVTMLTTSIGAQTCPEEPIVFVRQSQVDSFAILYPECTKLDIDITIGPSDDIVNLESLSNLVSCERLTVVGNQILPNLSGLEGLSTARNIIILAGNSSLASVDGLEGLQSCYSFAANAAESLRSISSISAIEDIEVLFLRGCPSLDSLIGFYKMDSVEFVSVDLNGIAHLDAFNEVRFASIGYNLTSMPILEHVSFFEKLEVANEITVSSNPAIQELDLLSALRHVDKITISRNQSLQFLSGFESLETVSEKLQIIDNPLLETIDGFSSLESVGTLELGNIDLEGYSIDEVAAFQNLTVVEHDMDLRRLNVSDLDFLQSVVTVGQPQNDSITNVLRIDSLAQIEDLSGLEAIMSVQDHILLIGNDNLTSLDGLAELDTAEVNNLSVIANSLLTDCANAFVCEYLQTGKTVAFANNGSGCSSLQEVQTACDILSSAAQTITSEIELFPNPTVDYIGLTIARRIVQSSSLKIYDMTGQRQQVNQTTEGLIDVSHLPTGVYQLVVIEAGQNTSVRFVRQ